jgi:hypothetical protein
MISATKHLINKMADHLLVRHFYIVKSDSKSMEVLDHLTGFVAQGSGEISPAENPVFHSCRE